MHARSALWVLATAALLSCDDNPVSSPGSGAVPSFSRAPWDDVPGEGGVVCTAFEAGRAVSGSARCETSLEVESGFGNAIVTSARHGPVTVTFSQPVHDVLVYGTGAVSCDGQPGSVVAHHLAGMTTTFPLEADRSDCGRVHEQMDAEFGDLVEHRWVGMFAFFPRAVVPGPREVTSLVINPPTVWEQQVCSTRYFWEIGGDFVRIVDSVVFCQTVPVAVRYVISFRETPPGPPELNITRAEGPNAGSFTTRAGENSLLLEAQATPGDFSAQVRWDLRDAPDDQVNSTPPQNVPVGTPVSVLVPAQDPTRWASIPHPGALSQKSLAFEVRASIDASGTVVEGVPRMVRQDEMDTIREEYIELGRAPVPSRGVFGQRRSEHFGPPHDELNSGDYQVYWLEESALQRLETLRVFIEAFYEQYALAFRGITVVGGYRNPVHHRIHRGHGYNSAHELGTAFDLRIWDQPITRERFFELLRTLARSEAVDACFEPAERIRRGNADRALDHAHIELTAPCPRGW